MSTDADWRLRRAERSERASQKIVEQLSRGMNDSLVLLTLLSKKSLATYRVKFALPS
jgi:hypothetical protein